MGFASAYRQYRSWLEKRPAKLEKAKSFAAEWAAIASKRNLWSEVKWTMAEKQEFVRYWKGVAGRHVPNYWNRLYEAINDKHCTAYLPDNLYATKIEPKLNDRVYTRVLEDKVLLELLFKSELVRFPETVLVSSAGRLLNGNREFVCEREANRLLRDSKDLVCKLATGSSSGRSVQFSGAENGFSGVDNLRKAMGGVTSSSKSVSFSTPRGVS